MNPDRPFSPSRKLQLASGVGGLIILVSLLSVAFSHVNRLATDPLILLWIAVGLCGGTAGFFLNGLHIPLRGAVVNLLGFGSWAILLGFGAQGFVNGKFLLLLGAHGESSLGGALLLGFGSGACQTLGKTVFCYLLIRKLPGREIRIFATCGLAVGLGFGCSEVLLLAEKLFLGPGELTLSGALFGGFERVSAVLFHTYSGGLIALAFLWRKPWPLVLVVIIHSLMDGLAVAGRQSVPLPVMESAILSLALASCLLYRRGVRA